jgi:folate-binding protein YgfZ
MNQPQESLSTREVTRDGIAVAGPDSASFLQSQLTQDIDGVLPGESRWSLVLSPQGKIVSLCRVTLVSPGEFLLDTEQGHGETLLDRLRRFKLRVKVSLDATSVRTARSGWSWDGWGAVMPMASPELSDEQPRPVATRPPPSSLDDRDDFGEFQRILAGFPRLGSELTESTIPQEAGEELVQRTISFTKGCYTGQELVARLDSRGSNVARRLCLLRGVSTGARVPLPGDTVRAGEKVVATLTSTAGDPSGSLAWAALGYVKRAALSEQPVPALVESAAGFEPEPALILPLGLEV